MDIVLVLVSVGVFLMLLVLWRIWSTPKTEQWLTPIQQQLQQIRAAQEKQDSVFLQQQELLREHFARMMKDQRQELADMINGHARAAQDRDHQVAQATSTQLKSFEERLARTQSELNQRFEQLRETVAAQLKTAQDQDRAGREEQMNTLHRFRAELNESLQHLTKNNSEKLDQVRTTVEKQLQTLQTDNAQKLEQMRVTVDEKLQSTLDKRLGDSFKQVSDRLEQVHKGLGEMQQLANGVGDLKRVLTNVKTRGTWGEVQLGNLLEQILAPEQFETNVATKPRSAERVEFAIKLPGRESDEPVWLPIDAKFPSEDYQRLLDAQERADVAAVEDAAKALDNRLKQEARTIRDKYIAPPHTTDFAILYLPTEGLYAEALRRPALAETLQRDYRVTLAGPTTLAAMLNSLQMGFRTLAIEKRSSEVWQVLGAVKTEFTKFGDLLAKTKKKLQETANTIDDAERKTRTITRKLKGVEALPVTESQSILALEEDDQDNDENE